MRQLKEATEHYYVGLYHFEHNYFLHDFPGRCWNAAINMAADSFQAVADAQINW